VNSRRHKGEDALGVVLPITPMLDMAFQLLTFFIFTYHPSALEGQMELQLPSDPATQAQKPEDVLPDAKADKNPNLEVPADLTVVVRTQLDGTNNGAISSLSVQDRAGSVAVRDLAELKDYLQKARENLTAKDAIKIQGDGKLKWGEIVQVMDVCRKAGFEGVSFVPPPDFGLSGQ
jgi:biopolymer transport protein ExbD